MTINDLKSKLAKEPGRSIELQAIVDQLLPCPHHGGEILFGSWPPYQWIQEHGWR